ncbi:hypothetical protein V2J09_024187 [Rumex salicifolius]
MLHVKAFELSIEITVFCGIKSLVECDSILVIPANDSYCSSCNGLGFIQRPGANGLAALAVDDTFHHNINILCCIVRLQWRVIWFQPNLAFMGIYNVVHI